MKKKFTNNEHKQKINDVLYYIFENLSSKLTIEELAVVSSYSPYHFQRIFKENTKQSVIEYIKELRLQWSANLLIFNPNSTVTEISFHCGFKSSATFTNEFKKFYGYTPTKWRKEGYEEYKLKQNDSKNEIDFTQIKIKKLYSIPIAYMRHFGYDKTISNTWQKFLYLLEKDFDIINPEMLGFHHSNPTITQLDKCRYVACAKLKEGQHIESKGDIGLCNIEGGLYATIQHKGTYSDVLQLYTKIYHEWLPSSEFEAINSKAYTIYYKNHFTQEDGKFDLEFRIPVTYK